VAAVNVQYGSPVEAATAT